MYGELINKTLAWAPLNKTIFISILFENGKCCYSQKKSIFINKEVIREVFKVNMNNRLCLFECGPKLGQNIIDTVCEFIINNSIDENKLQYLLLEIKNKQVKVCPGIHAPKKNFLNNLIGKIRGFLK